MRRRSGIKSPKGGLMLFIFLSTFMVIEDEGVVYEPPR